MSRLGEGAFASLRCNTNLAFKIAYLSVHFASLCVDNSRDSAAIPAVLALIEPGSCISPSVVALNG